MKKMIISLILICAIGPMAFAFDNPLLPGVRSTNLFGRYSTSLYDFSTNPAFFKISYLDDNLYYYADATGRVNQFRRDYDPKRQQDYTIDFLSIKQISEQVSMASSIQYDRTYVWDLWRSLEKDFYSEYFSYIDTTTGSTVFTGPQVRFVYNYAPMERVFLGFDIHYGVEQGLKDVYTQCETIARNSEICVGIGYISHDRKTSIGISGGYQNAQRKYEAVKEAQDAVVRTYFGYFMTKSENPRSTNRKNDNQEGYEINAQIERQDVFLNGLDLQMLAGWGEKSEFVSIGSVSKPTDLGYCLRNIRRLTGRFVYLSPDQRVSGHLLVENAHYTDWAETENYNVRFMDSEQVSNRFEIVGGIRPVKRFSSQIGGTFERISDNYSEYNSDFQYRKDRHNISGFVELQAQFNPVLVSRIRTTMSNEEPYFYWNTDKFRTMRITGSVERLFTFGTIGFDVNFEKICPDNVTDVNYLFGIAVTYMK
ncbi:MAG: hypothetical protein PHW79_08865 [Candidatus Marinimicrobia bacterium]|nr:hypothetical protein [Candidatus Neomarinimicrobiota bacterium]